MTSTDIAASIEHTARDIESAMITYRQAPAGMRLRADLIVALDQLHDRLSHQILILVRKYKEEK